MAEQDGWVPEFPGQRPPFQPGNELAIKHGARSLRKIQPIVDDLVTGVLRLAEADHGFVYLREPMYRPAVEAWARAEARVHLLTRWLEDHPPLETEGGASVLDQLQTWETRAEKTRQRLGLDPLSRARLGKDVAQTRSADIAALMAELDRRERQDHNESPTEGNDR